MSYARVLRWCSIGGGEPSYLFVARGFCNTRTLKRAEEGVIQCFSLLQSPNQVLIWVYEKDVEICPYSSCNGYRQTPTLK